IWHVLFSFDDKEKLKEWAQKRLALDDTVAEKFSEIQLKQGYARLSLRALRKILPYLKRGMIYSHAVFVSNIKEVIGERLWVENKQEVYTTIQEIIDDHKHINNLNYEIN